ncbi:MAG: pyridoxal-5'-phosphate-dependent protein subunit beta [Myxococcales bacterium]|nr:pyridoxal-5'-phosphate-dependent protein subunit beta [Myxococcales bacterium]
MTRLGLDTTIMNPGLYDNTVHRFRDAKIKLPTFRELAYPDEIPNEIQQRLADIGPDEAHPLNLFRVHWYNGKDRVSRETVPGHIVLSKELTGVDAPIVVAVGERFPMIEAHKVLAAYGCLAPRLVTGQFDPTVHRAVWPSTGNYCRGGVAISRIMQCRGVAVLPENMSKERFSWLKRWVLDETDIIKTPGSESNVKEIYDECNRLDRDPSNVIFNQFAEFGNHLVHYAVTGRALSHVFEHLRGRHPDWKLFGFTSATGSAGTIAAGDYLKDTHGSKTIAVEALECPTLLYNGFGEHNIQGIGDKHVPLIHNVYSSDVCTAISDANTDSLFLLFNTEVGKRYLTEKKNVAPHVVDSLPSLGFSGICNVLAAIKTARYYNLSANDVLVTVATDNAGMYGTEIEKILNLRFGGSFDQLDAAYVFGRYLSALTTDHYMEMTTRDKDRVFNLGYFTWVEQQGVSLHEFEARRRPDFWRGLHRLLALWDEQIRVFNEKTGA